MAKVTNNNNSLVTGSSTRQKLQNSKGYTESLEFSPTLGLIIFGKKSVTTNLRSLVHSITYFFVHTYIYVYTDINPITLHCSLAHVGNNIVNNIEVYSLFFSKMHRG